MHRKGVSADAAMACEWHTVARKTSLSSSHVKFYVPQAWSSTLGSHTGLSGRETQTESMPDCSTMESPATYKHTPCVHHSTHHARRSCLFVDRRPRDDDPWHAATHEGEANSPRKRWHGPPSPNSPMIYARPRAQRSKCCSESPT